MAPLQAPAHPATFKYGPGVGAQVGRRFRRKGEERQIARTRIERLFALAHNRALQGQRGLADRCVGLARRIAMRYQTGLTKAERDRLCRECHAYLAPGSSARIRVDAGMVRTTCLACGNVQRRPFVREQLDRRLAASALRANPPLRPTQSTSQEDEGALVAAPGSE